MTLRRLTETEINDERVFRSWMHEALCTLLNLGAIMSAELDALTAQVTQSTTIEQSAITLIQGMAAQIAANVNSPAALTALSQQLSTSATALAAAVTANTPAAPTPAAPAAS